MPTITVQVQQKRPRDATLEKLRELKAKGLKDADIARMWGVTRTRIGQLRKKL